jgi:hypothetical protein
MNADEPGRVQFEGMLKQVDRDLELDFIREFSTGGQSLKGLSFNNRRERIRVAIFIQKLPNVRFREGPMTYSEAYAECFGQPLEMRSGVKDQRKSEVTKTLVNEVVALSASSLLRVGQSSARPDYQGPRRAGIRSSVRIAKN